jgi:hypothetical protein
VFGFPINLSCSVHDRVKTRFRDFVPGLKSATSAEAVARVLGFNSNIALRTALRSVEFLPCVVTPERGVAFLAARGANVEREAFVEAILYGAVFAVQDREPELTSAGFGVERERDPSERWGEQFKRKRAELVSIEGIRQVRRALEFLKPFPRTKSIRRAVHSCWLKHLAERHAYVDSDGRTNPPSYVTNGALIAAALILGLSHRVSWHEGIRFGQFVRFNLSLGPLKETDMRLKPDGALVQARKRKRLARWERQGNWRAIGAEIASIDAAAGQ